MRTIPEFLSYGRHRIVFRHGNYVVKVPLNEEGLYDNWRERNVWLNRSPRNYCKYARCRMWGIALVMQYATFPGPLSDDKGYKGYVSILTPGVPKWIYAVDCGQVGYNRFGEIVAYDYGF